MAPSYIAGVVVVVTQLLPFLGIHIAGADLTTTINTIVAIIGGLVVLYRQFATGRSTLAGTRPSGFQG